MLACPEEVICFEGTELAPWNMSFMSVKLIFDTSCGMSLALSTGLDTYFRLSCVPHCL